MNHERSIGMNRACRKYYHDLKLLLPCRGRYSKKFLKTIRDDLAAFSAGDNHADYTFVCSRFGSPREMAENYYGQTDIEMVIHQIRTAHIFRTVVVCIILAVLVAFAFRTGSFYKTYWSVESSNEGYFINSNQEK